MLSKLSNLETKMEELNVAVKGLQSKVTTLEIDVDSVKTKRKGLNNNFTLLERNTVFVDEQVQELTAKTYKTITTSAIHVENCYTWRPTVDVKICNFKASPNVSQRAKKIELVNGVKCPPKIQKQC